MSACGWKSQFGNERKEKREIQARRRRWRVDGVCVFGVEQLVFQSVAYIRRCGTHFVHFPFFFLSLSPPSTVFVVYRRLSTGWLQMVWAISRSLPLCLCLCLSLSLHSSVDILLWFLSLISLFTTRPQLRSFSVQWLLDVTITSLSIDDCLICSFFSFFFRRKRLPSFDSTERSSRRQLHTTTQRSVN